MDDPGSQGTQKIKENLFGFCIKCETKHCCSLKSPSGLLIERPFLIPSDVHRIAKATNLSPSHFVDTIDFIDKEGEKSISLMKQFVAKVNVYNIKGGRWVSFLKDFIKKIFAFKNKEKIGLLKSNANGCVFRASDNSCGIYENRPIDCRIFPLDIIKIEGKYWWALYDDVCGVEIENIDELVDYEESELFPALKPYLSVWQSHYYHEKEYSLRKRRVLRPVNI